jgi:hypothetical protein
MGDSGSLIRSALRRLIVQLVMVCQAHLPVRHQKRFDPVVVTLLQDPISDGVSRVNPLGRRPTSLSADNGGCGFGHLEALAEGPGETLQQGAGQGPQGAVEVLDRLGIEGHLAEVGRG